MRPQSPKTLPFLTDDEIEILKGSLESSDASERLRLAFYLLGIDQKRFSEAHTKELKLNHLIYHRVLFEFSIPHPVFRSLAGIAFDLIQSSDLVAGHKDRYGQDSVGLWDLDVRSSLESDEEDPMVMSMEQSFIVTGKKSSGVEPGFLGKLIEDAAILFYREHSDSEKRYRAIDEMGCSLDALVSHYDDSLSSYLIKLTYEINDSKQVVPSEEDIERTSTMRKIKERFGYLGHTAAVQLYKFAKTRDIAEVNKEAILEVLANDVARSFGMTVQDQRLYRDRSSGLLRFLLKAKWVDNARLLQPLAGDAKNNRNYLVNPVVASHGSDIAFMSSRRIANLPLFFALLLVQSDRDGIGSEGQNKLTSNGELVGIDFGHAYPKLNPLLESLRFDFSFDRSEFKNYSIFSDVKRSELMMGVLILARQANLPIDKAIVKSYGEEFYAQWESIAPGSDEQVFDDYITKLKSMRAAEFHRKVSDGMPSEKARLQVAAEFNDLIDAAVETKARHMHSRTAVLKKFSGFLTLPATLIDVMQNIEKLLAAKAGNTSMCSPDGLVMLHHLRVIKNPVMQWHFTGHAENVFHMAAEFGDPSEAEEALVALRAEGYVTKELPVVNDGAMLRFMVPRNQLDTVGKRFSEDSIKQRAHPEDYALYKKLLADEHIAESLSKLAEYGLMATYELDQLKLVSDGGDEGYSASQFFREGLHHLGVEASIDREGATIIPLNEGNVVGLQLFLLEFHHHYRDFKKAWGGFEKMIDSVNKEFACGFEVGYSLVHKGGEFHFKVNMSGDDSKIKFSVDSERPFKLNEVGRVAGLLRYEVGAHHTRVREEERRRAQEEQRKRQAEEQQRLQRELEIRKILEAQQRHDLEQKRLALELAEKRAEKEAEEKAVCEQKEAFRGLKIELDEAVGSLIKVLVRDDSWWNMCSTLYNTSRFATEEVQLTVASVVRALLSEWRESPERHQAGQWDYLRERIAARKDRVAQSLAKTGNANYKVEMGAAEKVLGLLNRLIAFETKSNDTYIEVEGAGVFYIT